MLFTVMPAVIGLTTINADGATVSGIILGIISWVLGFAGILAILFIIYAGISFLTSSGNEKQAEKAKTILTNAVIGIIIIILSYTIVSFIKVNVAGALKLTTATSVSDTSSPTTANISSPANAEVAIAAAADSSEKDATPDQVVLSDTEEQALDADDASDSVDDNNDISDNATEDPTDSTITPASEADLGENITDEGPDDVGDDGVDATDDEIKSIEQTRNSTALLDTVRGVAENIFTIPAVMAAKASHAAIANNASNYAFSQKGVKESGSSNKGKAIQKFFNATSKKKGDCTSGHMWCAAFVSWSFKKAGVKEFHTCSSIKLIKRFASKKRGHKLWEYSTKSKLKLKWGDVLWRKRGSGGHVGIVWYVNTSAKTVYVVEGNSANKVRVRVYKNYGKSHWNKVGRY